MSDVHNIVLMSNASLDHYPGNTLTSFTNVMPSELHLSLHSECGKRWHVGLESLCFDTNFTNTPPFFDACHPHFVAAASTKHFMGVGLQVSEGRQEVSIPTDRNYTTTAEFMLVLNNLFAGELYNKVIFDVEEKTSVLSFTGEDAVLLIHPRIVDFFNFASQPNEIYDYLGKDYYKYTFRFNKNNIWHHGETGFSLRANIPSYVRVVMSNLYNNPGSEHCANTLAVFPFTKPQKGGAFFAEVSREERLKLTVPSLKSLSVRLLDENGQQLHLAAGQPTFLKMSIQNRIDGSFLMRISSKDPSAVGNNSDFRMNLTTPLILQKGVWKVALSSVQFPNRFLRFTREDAAKVQIRVREAGKEEGELMFLEEDFTSVVNLVSILSAELSTRYMLNVHMEHYHLLIKFTMVDDSETELLFDNKLAILLGMVDFHSPDEMHSIKGKKETVYSSPFKINLGRLSPTAMMIFSDVVEPVIVGSHFSKIMKIIPAEASGGGAAGTMQSYESRHLDFVPVAYRHIPSIHMRLLQTDEQPITFANEDEEVLYNLLFTFKK